MKLNGSHKFKVSSQQVFNGILNPTVLQSCIPGCDSVEFLEDNRIRANITTPIPGLKGPYGVEVKVAQTQAPNFLSLEVKERGTGGAIDASSQIHIADEPDGAMLTYNATADLDGPIKLADNPIGRGITNTTLNSFFSNLEKAIV